LLRLSAAAAGAAALSPILDWRAFAKDKIPPAIGIVGGGVAGLTAAYRLQAVGVKPVLFEASSRWGGRMFTVYDFYKGMFCELGGEFVDTGHEDLQKLGTELGVEMQKLATEGEAEDLYFFRGAFHTPNDMVDPAKKSGAFAPIAEQIAADAEKLTDKDDNWTKHARKLDKMSLKAYHEQFRGKTDDWAIDLLDVAYNIEFGLLTEDLSSLAMVDFISSDLSVPFQMFGESDEIYRIKGGSSALIKALTAALESKADMRPGHALTALDRKAGKIVLTFAGPDGEKSESFDAVILALPFTKLRQVEGLKRLKLPPEQSKFVNLAWQRVPRSCRARRRACGAVPTLACRRPRTAPSIPISVFRIYGTRAAISPAKPVSSPIFSESNPASPTRNPRSQPSAPTYPRCRRR
jgi:monoamine oxidase